MSAADRVFLEACVELAERGRMTCAPNPTVGCLIVRDGTVIGRGYHAVTGEGHAEANALADAGGEINGATVYVSLEPCSFEGRTPSCAQTLIESNVSRVVAAAADPHIKVQGEGMNMLQRAGIEAELIPLDSAQACIEGYSKRVSQGRPLVRLKTASSLDGATALASGESQWITGEAARTDVQYWRARADAIVTGVETVIADDPQMTVRDDRFSGAKQPLRVVLDTQLRTPPSAKILNEAAPSLLLHDDELSNKTSVRLASQLLGAQSLGLAGGPRNLSAVLDELGDRGCNEILIEAGPQVIGSFLREGLWDYWVAYLAPKWLGNEVKGLAEFGISQLAHAPHAEVTDVQQIGHDLRVILRRIDE